MVRSTLVLPIGASPAIIQVQASPPPKAPCDWFPLDREIPREILLNRTFAQALHRERQLYGRNAAGFEVIHVCSSGSQALISRRWRKWIRRKISEHLECETVATGKIVVQRYHR